MTSSPPPEAPYYRGKTLTPESPCPVHLPEPSNIPVLQNQIDPVFNQMSTHMEPGTSSHDTAAADLDLHNGYGEATSTSPSTLKTVEDSLGNGTTMGNANWSAGDANDDYAMSLDFDDGDDDEESSTAVPNQSSSNYGSDVSPMVPSEGLAVPSQARSTNEIHGLVDNPSELLLSVPPDSYTALPDVATSPSMNDNARAVITASDTSGIDSGVQNLADASLAADVSNGGVNYQTLLDNLSPSTATAAFSDGITTATTASPSASSNIPRPASAKSPTVGHPIPTGLPPRPPPQEKPAIHPNYAPGDDIRSYHQLHTQTPTAPPTYASPASSSYRPSHGFPPPVIAGAPGTAAAPGGLPPPPLATFQQPPPPGVSQPQQSPSAQTFRNRESSGRNAPRSVASADGDEDQEAWAPDVQKKYDDFLSDERVYVTEGLWDRFPSGSRLFIGASMIHTRIVTARSLLTRFKGNLPTEKVTKRDLFHIFHKHGKLAQVSIKQAYGFVQFLDAAACSRALQTEQGMSVRGRRMRMPQTSPT